MLKNRDHSHPELQVDALDGLRGLAVLLVLISHVDHAHLTLLPGLHFAGGGKTGVFLFFVLSAFLLTLPLAKDPARAFSPFGLASYALRRVLRIYPLYALYLLTAVVTTALLKPPFKGLPLPLTPGGALAHVLLLKGDGVTWSITVEFKYYFLLPLFAFLLAVVLRGRLLPAVLATAAAVLAATLLYPPAGALINDFHLGPYLPLFLIGSLTAVLHLRFAGSSLAARPGVRRAVEAAGIAALLALLLLMPPFPSLLCQCPLSRTTFHRQFLLYGILCSTVLFAAANGAGLLRRLFELPALRYLGFISFSVYLLHPITLLPFQSAALAWLRPLGGWLGIAFTIAVSHLTYVAIERPTSRVRLRPRARPVPGALPAAPGH